MELDVGMTGTPCAVSTYASRQQGERQQIGMLESDVGIDGSEAAIATMLGVVPLSPMASPDGKRSSRRPAFCLLSRRTREVATVAT